MLHSKRVKISQREKQISLQKHQQRTAETTTTAFTTNEQQTNKPTNTIDVNNINEQNFKSQNTEVTNAKYIVHCIHKTKRLHCILCGQSALFRSASWL